MTTVLCLGGTVTDFRPYGAPLPDLCAIPVHLDPEVPAGTAVFDLDPEEPRHVTGIRVHDAGEFELTDDQVEQVRDHYRAMNERAGRLLAEWRALERFAVAAVPALPHPLLRITDI